MELKDKIIVVTGAASGIGRAFAHRFAKDGTSSSPAPTATEGVQETAAAVGGIAHHRRQQGSRHPAS